MFESIGNFFKKFAKKNEKISSTSKEAAKERLHLVLMQDRANVSADFLELMKQEIIEVIKKYIEIDEREIDVRLTNKENADGTNGAPALYANIPILNIKNDVRKMENQAVEKEGKEEKEEKVAIKEQKENPKENKEENKEQNKEEKKQKQTAKKEKKENAEVKENKTEKKVKKENKEPATKEKPESENKKEKE